MNVHSSWFSVSMATFDHKRDSWLLNSWKTFYVDTPVIGRTIILFDEKTKWKSRDLDRENSNDVQRHEEATFAVKHVRRNRGFIVVEKHAMGFGTN